MLIDLKINNIELHLEIPAIILQLGLSAYLANVLAVF